MQSHLLWWCATLATLAAAEVNTAPLRCDRLDSDANVEVICRRGDQFRMRMTHAVAEVVVGGRGSRLIFFCDATQSEPDDYLGLRQLNLTLGDTESVVLSACHLPAERLQTFLSRLGVTGVQLLKVMSHNVLNDTMPADFLAGLEVRRLKLDSLTRLELHDDFLRSSPQLEKLTIAGTQTGLPAGLLRHSPRLQWLGLYDLDAGELPPTLFHGLRNLATLLLGWNRLHSLSREHLRDLTQLKVLELYHNQLETLPDDLLTTVPLLEVLDLEKNPLTGLPQRLLAGTPRLKKLKLNGGLEVSGDLGRLPSGLFEGLEQLELLTLDRLGVRQLPADIFSGLISLRNLTLDHNPLQQLPEKLFSGLANVQNIDLRSVGLTKLPPGLLRGLSELDTLYLADNKLELLPESMFRSTPKLGRLFLQKNRLQSIQRQMFSGLQNSLWLLNLANNTLEMESTSTALQELSKLRELFLQRNLITGVSEQLRLNLLHLKHLDLRYNQLTSLGMADLNFLTRGANVYMQHNQIQYVHLQPILAPSQGEANRIHIGDNPLTCDCKLLALKQYTDRSGPFEDRTQTDAEFELVMDSETKQKTHVESKQKTDAGSKLDGLRCAGPPPFEHTLLSAVSADSLVCPLPQGRMGGLVGARQLCPDTCSCSLQPSQATVITDCPQLPATPLPPLRDHLASYGRRLLVQRAGLRQLTNLSTSSLSELHLSHNAIADVRVDQLPDGLRELRLDFNNISHIGEDFVAYLSRPENNVTRVWLAGNPLVCDCALLPLHQYLQLMLSEGRRQVVDAAELRCSGTNSTVLAVRADELCPTSMATIVGACLALALIAALLVAAVVYYRHGEWLKVWLYSRGLCLWLVTEEELDADKKYDAFISYSHKDEEFVLSQLVKPLEQEEPKYALCLHFRDWLAGEWITDQIERSVQDSRRVLIVMSQNFIESEWGRMEFLAAHKQALNDKTNRVIVVVYGELPPTEQMDPELRLYISSNTYLKWGDALFWERLRYALPHRGRQLKKRRRRKRSEKLGLISREAALSPTTPTDELAPPAQTGNQSTPQKEKNGCQNGHSPPGNHMV